MAEKKFTVSMDVENIGPHYGVNKLTFSEAVDSNKAIFYATNGTGKSFISRAFRLCTPFKAGLIADELLTIGEQKGHFTFGIRDDHVDKKLDISVERGKPPVVSNASGLMFHVFNSDYVEENIKAKHYSPDGRIEGYILGKVQIDLTEEKRVASSLEKEIDTDSKAINITIDEAKAFLREKGVTANTTEFQAITREKAERGFGYDAEDSVEQCIQNLETLEAVPENLADVQFSVPRVDLSFLDQLASILKTTFPKSEWDEEFVKEYKDHQAFIETGLDYDHADKICPFCKREYDTEALSLIHLYNQYRNDQEARIVGQLRSILQSVTQMSGKLDEEQRKISAAESQLSGIQRYFPSLTGLMMEKLGSCENYKKVFQSLADMISRKMDNLSAVIDGVDDLITNCKQAWTEVSEIQKKNNSTVVTANKTKNDARSERLSLRRSLCKAKSLTLQKELSDSFKNLSEKRTKLEKLQAEIVQNEQQARISKREKVYETLESSLNRFFNGKYQIDKDTFQIKFLGNKVGENASSILSDGEKSIVAFCWYLAETHTIVSSEDDYNKLFFVIDDPISSMDFHFVYAVAQAIRDIKSTFGIAGYERVWIFTHNNEFFSIVMRNNILAHAFMMKPGSIQPFNHKLLLPYENHLLDLAEIANGKKTPNHTTGNSIRHVIETVSKFEDPGIGLDTYVRDHEMLSKDSCIFSLCQDLSHGNVRMEPPYSEDVLREAAKIVIEFIRVNYPGQLKGIA